MNSYALILSYNGADFSGFARQKDPAISTVQETLEQALTTVLRLDAPLLTVCAGRTDAGVHAREQVLSFELDGSMLDDNQCRLLVRSVNALTPESMNVKSIQPAKEGFSARFDAQSRQYHYHIFNQTYPPVFTKDFAWHVSKKLDLALMQQAAQGLMGEHDFHSFCTAQSVTDDKNTVRTICEIEVTKRTILGEELVIVSIVGSAFLHSQVRIMVGTLQEIAAGKRSSDDIPRILSARNREAAGVTAPAHGLMLYQVSYPEDCF